MYKNPFIQIGIISLDFLVTFELVINTLFFNN